MANLTVRNVDDDLVQALKARALEHGNSAEAEHRLLLDQALRRVKKQKSLVEQLLEIPKLDEGEEPGDYFGRATD